MCRPRRLVAALTAVVAVVLMVLPTAGAAAATESCPRAALFSAYGSSAEGEPALLRYWTTGGGDGAEVVFMADGLGEIGRSTLRRLPEDSFISSHASELAPTSLPRGTHRINATVTGGSCGRDLVGTAFHVVYGGSQPAIDGAYAAILGRTADRSGLAYFSGRAPADVAAALLASDERPAGIVRQVYRRYLSREPDASGLAHWTEQLRSGMPPESLVTTVFGFDEPAGPFFLYEAFLDRAVARAEASSWADVWASGRDPEPAIFASAEARSRAVAGTYHALLGRAPDSGGHGHWTQQLASGWPAADMLMGVLSSAEYGDRLG